MASTSVSSVQKSFKYDVFLSFRGEDTRKTFVDHLYHALHDKGIITYKDDEEIEEGKRISDELITAIEDPRFHIIVFSKNYASSSWCLHELVKIMECQKMIDHIAYPIFYDVEPTEVRNQCGTFGEAFAKHEKRSRSSIIPFNHLCSIVASCCSGPSSLKGFTSDLAKENDFGRWRSALKEAAELAGMELKTTFDGHEAKFIHQIVQDVSLKLHLITLSIDGKLVGMETRLKNIVSSIEIGSEDVRMIGIKGMGGGGKTTLARVAFNHISIGFEGKSFVENVRQVSKGSPSGLMKLQKQVLKDVLNKKHVLVTSVFDGKDMMKKVMSSRKVLIVLDDVDDIEQLEALAGELTWFKPGSRIIITTRDEQVLAAQRVNFIHDVSLLSNEEAVCLFSRYAFGRDIPIEGYEELSTKVVHYAAGLPLTIKVLGSHLCRRSKSEWEDALERLKTIPLKETLEKLELSYNDLQNDQKEILLDVVCILKGEMKEEAIRILGSCGLNAQIGLRVLEQKSLITISSIDGLCFHDHIEEMGWNIVRRLHPDEPSRHSRLWIKEEIEDILVNELGTKATRGIKLRNTDLDPEIIMKGLRSMKELRFLSINTRHGTWNTDGDNQYLPDTLQSLNWRGYPFQFLPKTFQANKLVNLELVASNITELWEGGDRKVLNNIKFIDLTCSKLRTFDLSMTPNLEKLNLQGCYGLLKLHMPAECPKLTFLNLCGSEVKNLDLGLTPNLKTLSLQGCKEFEKLHLPIEFSNLKTLDLVETMVSSLDLKMIPHLEELKLGGCYKFVKLHMPVECSNLKSLNLSGSMVSYLNLGMTPHLEELNLNGCIGFVELHLPLECLNLKSLYLSGSKVSNLNLGMIPHLEELNLQRCYRFVELHMPIECSNLKSVNLSGSMVSNFNLGMTPHLEELNLRGCYEFVELHLPIECSNLKYLNLSGSKVRNLNLGMTPLLETLDLSTCIDFVELHMLFECPNLKFLNLSGSKVSNLNLGMTTNLETLELSECYEFVELHLPLECMCLKSLDLRGSKVSNLNLGMIPHIEKLNLQGCYCLQEIHAPVGCLKKLVYLDLTGSLRFEIFLVNKLNSLASPDSATMLELNAESVDICPLHPNSNLPKFQFQCKYVESRYSWSGNVEKLVSFGLCACTNLESFSESICSLKHLEDLTLKGSILEVPKDLWQLESLEKLYLTLKVIKHLPNSICMLKHLKYLVLESCWLLKQLPTDLGRLECLEELSLMNLRDIPNISNMKCLRRLHLSFCSQVKELPGQLRRLESACRNLEYFSASICGLQNLRELTLEGSIPEVPQGIYLLESLEKLTLSIKEIKQLPEDLGRLEHLKWLCLMSCIGLRDIPDIICNMKCLERLYLCNCIFVENLPEELGRLECLKELNINGTSISHLPQSIYQLKNLRIYGASWQLHSYGFASVTTELLGHLYYVEL
ncbi:uncharacterized protein LOC143556613 [Bidens hawaiensis]|uniref:uncharacterized protein LOC143556613 n=1 Tax=Bidens hawaiensis TaxID=980011 RepID=UPI004048FA85